MNNVIQDKHKQRDIVIQFCNSLYENTVLTIIKSVWYLKYAEIKQILYLFPKQILYDFKSIFHIWFWDVLMTKLIDEYYYNYIYIYIYLYSIFIHTNIYFISICL